VLFEVVQRGLYVTDTVSWLARQIPEIANMGSFEKSIFVRRKRGGVACQQWGSAGNRLWKFDESSNIWSDTLPERVDTFNLYIGTKPYTDHTMFFAIYAPNLNPPVHRPGVTFDECDTWPVVKDLNGLIGNDGSGGFWARRPASNHYAILHPWTNAFALGKSVQTPIGFRDYNGPTFLPIDKAFYGSDTTIWIQSLGFYNSDLGIGALGDT